ncbi:PIN domain-containing protein [Cuniculiplasma sp. SKW4]|uniref:PIN domain-containing protein n=1 Tax=Cuniculiplasma sp. SKW4 TaxID=3400171 RepID=UPI003FD3E9FD
MKDDLFYDTNILIYAYDLNEPVKRKICKKIVEDVFLGRKKGIISIQVLVELYNAMTRKLDVNEHSAMVIVESFIDCENWIKITYNEATVKNALKSSLAFRAPFLDTLISETMKEYGINLIITENEKDFHKIPGISVINPLISNI